MDMCTFGGLNHFFARGIHLTIGNVVANGVVEQHRVLWHDPNVPSKTGLLDIANILSVDLDLTALHIIKTVQESCQC